MESAVYDLFRGERSIAGGSAKVAESKREEIVEFDRCVLCSISCVLLGWSAFACCCYHSSRQLQLGCIEGTVIFVNSSLVSSKEDL